jgi:transcriptional regulator with XRE-family HTH domain
VHPAHIIGIVQRVGTIGPGFIGPGFIGPGLSNGVVLLRKDAAYVPEVRSPTVRRRELGALLRKLRLETGLTVERAAERLLFSMSKLSRIETGQDAATLRNIRDFCDLYGVTAEAERDRMMNLAVERVPRGLLQTAIDGPEPARHQRSDCAAYSFA